ncbi:MAG: FxsA family protein [Solirubrobacterales bacterium]|nr:FxsA family protein [Solirubrobacterales bacterium]
MALLLLILFIALPIAEIYVIVQVGQAIGILPTLAILLLDGFVGAALARSQGQTAWARFNRVLSEGRVPARETFDGAMIILGGALLLAPGFITDVVGFLLLKRPDPFRSRRSSPGYDYEGTAREVTDPSGELPDGDHRG